MNIDNSIRQATYKLPGTLRLVNPCGMELTIPYSDITQAFQIMAAYGEMGCTSTFPDGGYTFPYEYADSFDFRLIGASEFTINDNGETIRCLKWRGQIYKRRTYEATTGARRMPAKIKYSRGSRPGDPPHLVEPDAGDAKKGYVTLITFVGAGKLSDIYLKPNNAIAAA